MTRTSKPARLNSIAKVMPVGPAPTIRTCGVFIGSSRQTRLHGCHPFTFDAGRHIQGSHIALRPNSPDQPVRLTHESPALTLEKNTKPQEEAMTSLSCKRWVWRLSSWQRQKKRG